LIPEEPSYVPSADAQPRALDAFRAFLTKEKPFQVKASTRWDEAEVEIEVEVSDDIQFVHPGVNFESVSCPACGTKIELKIWEAWMNGSYKSEFVDRSVTMPCCGCEMDLNSLRYDGPAGFARFALRAVNPDIENGLLPADKLSVLEEILGCKLRQIGAHI
jgi:transcription elongation factor Elf1